MSIHKLTAGSGYDYLTRQVAALDATDKGHVGLASYYTAKGETPGVWVGSGMEGIEGLDAGDVVTADQMQALFGSGHHPLATQRTRELDQRVGRDGAERPTVADYKVAMRLGTPYKVYTDDVSDLRVEVAKRLAALNQAAGLPGDWPLPAAERARVRTEVARDFFRAEYGRDAADARELAATIAKHSRPKTTAVAGFDLTFSPVKSVSVLWALADKQTAAVIERAHHAAVQDALAFLEAHALFTREGTNGVRQVEVRGLVATAFTHRDSRAGDPDLHTHVAVANKVQTLSGKWLAIDGRLLFKSKVSASETYNTALEHHLVDALGVRFKERPNPDARKRPVREVVGVEAEVSARFSKRRASVEGRRTVLVAQFQATHGRPPTPIETLHLAQQATLETREAKREPRSLDEQRTAWHREAVEVLGSERRLARMVRRTLHPPAEQERRADSAWFAETVDQIVRTMQGGRATWQYWHVYAEAMRQVRTALVPTEQVEQMVALLVAEVLDAKSVRITRPVDDITEPAPLRRRDGSSAYTVAGVHLFTSAAVLAAEQRLVEAAGRYDGRKATEQQVGIALLESEANETSLNPGQATLVREMATSGARVQLAIAPAGSGKTTAMHALARAWTEGGGTVLGLAPSAAAAEALGSQMKHTTDTLAKLVYTLIDPFGQVHPPAWFKQIGPSTLVVIDEAGMADTLSLDVAVHYVLSQGGNVRLIGDDQQLSAIGAGGVLRDIRARHGALQLSELIRFTDPAEGAASLALRQGRTEALGFYLDHARVHVGDQATMTADVFESWRADRARGLDSIMLAPTRELVSQLNQQARAHRLAGAPTSPDQGVRRLADGNNASVGELIITRENDRKLRVSATDWVKNSDRWIILETHRSGDLTIQHTQHGRTVRLPAEYVDKATELGYACTIHTAQGVTADTMHGLVTGSESRQQLYTMLTRGKLANHVYVEVVGDGDPHSVIHPTLVWPLTPTDILEQILAHDEAPQSATSQLVEQADPRVRLGEVTQRYLDSLYFAAEHTLGPAVVDALETAADQMVPGLVDEAAWPTLRAHLLLLGAHGIDPVDALRTVAAERELGTATDRAAVLDWRLDPTGFRSAGPGPLPWVPSIPARLAENPRWGSYLAMRAELVATLGATVLQEAVDEVTGGSLPEWCQYGLRPSDPTIADVELWRAATQVPTSDQRPTGALQLGKAAAAWQRRLNRRVRGDHSPALKEWSHLLDGLAPHLCDDDFAPVLAQRLAAISRCGVATPQLLRAAVAAGPLPDDHPTAALWWRMARHLTPAVAAQIGQTEHVTAGWVDQLINLVGIENAERLQESTWWPALVANIDHALARGWCLETLLAKRATHQHTANDTEKNTAGDSASGGSVALPGDGVDECLALVWRTSIALHPIPTEDPGGEVDDSWTDPPPEDLWEGVEAPVDDPTWVIDNPGVPLHALDSPDAPDLDATTIESEPEAGELDDEDRYVEGDLAVAALIRASRPVLEQTESDVRRMFDRAEQWDQSPVTRERMLEINDLTQEFFETCFTDSWGREYLADRFGIDLAGNQQFRPGQAPAGWNHLVTHLRRLGVTDQEMLATGVATTARTGRLIDRFRDRVMLPIIHHRTNEKEILGFVGRRHPQLTDTDADQRRCRPKYLNTADTPLFHKGAQLFGLIGEQLGEGAVPVIVEGPMDAIAVTLAADGRYVGLTPLGTSLTDEQATQLSTLIRSGSQEPIVATDADLAGQIASERDFWLLTPHGLDPLHARFPSGWDPAELLTVRGPAALAATLDAASPLGDLLLAERLDNLAPEQARPAATKVLAARTPGVWDTGTTRLSARLGLTHTQARRDLRDAIRAWDADPRRAAAAQLAHSNDVRARLQATVAKSPAERWAGLAVELDPRLIDQTDWPATATILDQAHEQGHDVTATAHALVAERALGDQPARDLRYRLVSRLEVTINTGEQSLDIAATSSNGAEHPHQRQARNQATPGRGPKR